MPGFMKDEWLLSLLRSETSGEEGHYLDVLRDVSKVWSSVLTGGAQAKVVTDSAVSLVAIFTGQSISAAFQKDFSVPNWNQALIIVRKYRWVPHLTEKLEDSQYLLIVENFSVFTLTSLMRLEADPIPCLDYPDLQKKLALIWHEQRSNHVHSTHDSQTQDSCAPLNTLLDLLDHPSNKNNGKFPQLSADFTVDDFLVPPDQAEKLESLTDWQCKSPCQAELPVPQPDFCAPTMEETLSRQETDPSSNSNEVQVAGANAQSTEAVMKQSVAAQAGLSLIQEEKEECQVTSSGSTLFSSNENGKNEQAADSGPIDSQSQEDFAASLDLHLTCTARTTQDDTESPYVLARIQGASHVPEDEEKIISCGPDANHPSSQAGGVAQSTQKAGVSVDISECSLSPVKAPEGSVLESVCEWNTPSLVKHVQDHPSVFAALQAAVLDSCPEGTTSQLGTAQDVPQESGTTTSVQTSSAQVITEETSPAENFPLKSCKVNLMRLPDGQSEGAESPRAKRTPRRTKQKKQYYTESPLHGNTSEDEAWSPSLIDAKKGVACKGSGRPRGGSSQESTSLDSDEDVFEETSSKKRHRPLKKKPRQIQAAEEKPEAKKKPRKKANKAEKKYNVDVLYVSSAKKNQPKEPKVTRGTKRRLYTAAVMMGEQSPERKSAPKKTSSTADCRRSPRLRSRSNFAELAAIEGSKPDDSVVSGAVEKLTEADSAMAAPEVKSERPKAEQEEDSKDAEAATEAASDGSRSLIESGDSGQARSPPSNEEQTSINEPGCAEKEQVVNIIIEPTSVQEISDEKQNSKPDPVVIGSTDNDLITGESPSACYLSRHSTPRCSAQPAQSTAPEVLSCKTLQAASVSPFVIPSRVLPPRLTITPVNSLPSYQPLKVSSSKVTAKGARTSTDEEELSQANDSAGSDGHTLLSQAIRANDFQRVVSLQQMDLMPRQRNLLQFKMSEKLKKDVRKYWYHS